jgi:hypothetical protein
MKTRATEITSSRENPDYGARTPKYASGSVGVISKVLLILEALQRLPVGLGLKGGCDATALTKARPTVS